MTTRVVAWRATLTCLIAGVFLAAAAMAEARITPKETRNLRKAVDALVAAGAPGAILVVRDGDRTVRLAGGLADVARKTPMRPAHRVRIASLTKSYTSTVVLQLVAEGKLTLNDNIEQWLPGLVPNGDKITIHHLLNHTSGIFDHEGDPRVLKPYFSGDLGHYWAPRKLVEFAVSHGPLFAPGATRSSYSNTNYVILGLIVEAATGKPIGTELKSRIFKPLQLDATSYPTTPRMPRPHAHGYLIAGEPPAIDVTQFSPSLSPASGAIVSTAADVADFYRALLSGRLLTPDLLQAMKTTIEEGAKVDFTGQRYGLGLESYPFSCGLTWGHNGGFPGYFNFAVASEDGGRQAVLTVNQDATSLPKQAGILYYKLIVKAYCATA